MKKGSRLQKCKMCGKPLFWRIPKGYLFGVFPEVEHKKVNNWKPSPKHRAYLCEECLEMLEVEVKNPGVYLAMIDRFGYTMIAVGRTEEEAKDAITSCYTSVFRDTNGGESPKNVSYGDGTTYYDVMLEELCVMHVAYGSVKWL